VAVRKITVSDISGTELTEDEQTRVIVEHPDFPAPLEIDISADEALRLQDSTLRLVTFTILGPNRPPRRAVVETKMLDRLFEGVDINAVLEGARRVEIQRKPAVAASAPKRIDRVDYSSPDYAGVLHRGRVTEREAYLVRNDLARANANRQREGQPPIDADDPKEQARYGL
jgi:hypothetical protein